MKQQLKKPIYSSTVDALGFKHPKSYQMLPSCKICTN